MANKERPVAASKDVEESTTSGVDITMAESQEERLPEVGEKEVVGEMAPLTDVLSTRVDESRPSRTIASPTVQSVPIPLSSPEDIASSLGTALEPSYSASADILRLTGVPILSVAAAAITDDDISIGPIAGPRVSLVQPLVNQFLVYLSTVVPKSQVSSLRHFDVAPADRLKQLIDRLRVWLSLLVDLRADLEASIEQAASELWAKRELMLEETKKHLEAERGRHSELSLIVKQRESGGCQVSVKEIERTLVAAKTKEVELSQAVEVSRVQACRPGFVIFCLLDISRRNATKIATKIDGPKSRHDQSKKPESAWIRAKQTR